MAKASVRDLKGTRLLKGLLTGDAKATFNLAALDIGICIIDNYNKVLLKMNKHALPIFASCKQQRYFRGFRSTTILTYVSRIQ